jgi:adenylate cyclase, class 2
VAAVRKQRRNFRLAWQGHKVEVALDQVAGVGHFVELEISATDETLDGARQALADLATRLELAASERRSYLELLLAGR